MGVGEKGWDSFPLTLKDARDILTVEEKKKKQLREQCI